MDEYLDWHYTHTRKGVSFFFMKYLAERLGMVASESRLEEGRLQYQNALHHLESNQLRRSTFIAGRDISIADLACYAELGPLQFDDEFGPLIASMPGVRKWMAAMRAQPWHDEVMVEVKGVVCARQALRPPPPPPSGPSANGSPGAAAASNGSIATGSGSGPGLALNLATAPPAQRS